MTASGGEAVNGEGLGTPEVFEPARLGPVTLKNRIIKAATFEGAAPRGEVTDQLIEFHRRMASGGVGMTTVAYLAVAPEGRTDRHCVLLGEESLPGLRRLTETVHDAGAAVSAQIGHAGPVANARSNGAPSLAPSRRFSPSGSMTRAASDDDIARITEQYRQGAAVSRRGRIRLHRNPPRAQLSAQCIPESEAESPNRPVGRKPGQPRPLPAPGGQCGAGGSRGSGGSDRQAQHGRRGSRWILVGGEHRVRPDAGDRRWARRHRAHRWELALQSHVPLQGRGADGRSLPPPFLRPCGSVSGRWDRGSCATTRSRRHSSCPMPGSSSMRSGCPSSCWAGSTDWTRSNGHSPRGSRLWPWPGRCCGSPTWSAGGRRA